MKKLTDLSIAPILPALCLVVIFGVFPASIYYWQTHQNAAHQVALSEAAVLPVAPPSDLVLPENSEAPPLPSGTEAVDFNSKTVDGQNYTFHSHGPNIKVLDFWATWCGPCHMSIPELEDVSSSLGPHGVSVVGVSVDTDTANQVGPTVKELGMKYTVLVDPKDNIDTQLTYNAGSLPSVYIIDGKGIVRWSYAGYWPGEEPYIRHIIGDLLAGKPVDLP
jgi:thiol-disulfide isomerase/thioredoxin